MSIAAVLLGLLVAAAWRPVRPRHRRAARTHQRRWAVRWPPHRPRRRRSPELAVVVTEVASRLRTGAPPETAWAATVERLLGPDPPVWSTSAVADVPPALARLAAHCAAEPGAAAAARTVVAASRLTQALGAPLADVLDRCAATVTEAEQARDARRVALAGPRSTARILSALPLLGLLLGAGLGADPLAAATDGAWGTVSVSLGLVLVAAGRRWTHALVTAAEGPAGPSRRRRPPPLGP